ncbi:unnamed protein product [Mucor hiemalis]
MLLTARRVKHKIILVVYSHTTSKTTEFNIATLELDIPTAETEKLEDGSFVLLLNTLHIQKGPEVPVYCAITPSGKRCIFASEVKYNRVRTEGGERMDIVEEEKKKESPTYQWSQEGADITILFQLPLGTTKSNISCKFVKDHIILLVQSDNTIIVSYPYRKLWSTVKTDECVWTYDAKSGLLSLFLTKMDEYTRWPQLFDCDDGVLETISPVTLEEIRNKMNKFTAEEEEEKKEGTMVLAPSHVQPAQHPAATDMDEEIDEAGQPVIFSVYDMQGNEVDEFSSGTYSWICKSYDSITQLPSLCLQMDVDGLVFKVEEDANLNIHITHEATFDAFAFVQASKRDGRFVLFDPHYHFTSIIESGRNAYIYFHHDDKRVIEMQTLVDLTLGHQIDVLGAQLMENNLMILTESQIIVIELYANIF